jgi:hypothetical protein
MFAITAGAGLLVTSPAYAQGEPQAPDAAQAAEPLVVVPIATATPAEPSALSDQELDALRGGDGIILTTQTLLALTTGNVINGNYVAGSVSLSDSALSNFNGVGNLLINTGAQNSLQSGMNLTINVGN